MVVIKNYVSPLVGAVTFLYTVGYFTIGSLACGIAYANGFVSS